MDLKEFGRELSDEVFLSAATRGRRVKVPWGRYHVALHQLSFGYSSKGAPMITTGFRVLDGDYAGQIILRHNVTVHDWQLEQATEMLRRLANDDTPTTFPFTDIKKCSRMLGNIKAAAEYNGLSYIIEYYPSNVRRFPMVDIVQINT